MSPAATEAEIMTIAPVIEGRVCGLVGNLLHGWAWSPGEPYRHWAVAVYHGGTAIALAMADQYHPQSPGDGSHGFSLMVSDDILSGKGQLQVYLANNDRLIGVPISLPVTKSADKLFGHSRVVVQPGLVLAGWLVDPDETNKATEVQVWEGGQLLAQSQPDRWVSHQGLQVEGGFRLKLPMSLADGKPHTLYITDSQGRELEGSPVSLQEWPQGLGQWLEQQRDFNSKEVKALFKQQVERYEQLLPRGVDMADYEHWWRVFGQPDQPPGPVKGRVGVILLGYDPKAVERTRHSLQSQKNVHWQLWQVKDVKDFSLYKKAISQAADQCQFVTQIYAGDTLPVHALAMAAQALVQEQGQLVYSDHDAPDEKTGKRQPLFKPAWDRDRFWCQDYVGAGLCLVRSEVFNANLPRGPADFSYCAVAKIVDADKNVLHLPWVLRHHFKAWPSEETAAPLDLVQTRLSDYDAQASVTEHPQFPGIRRLKRHLKYWPDVALIIPTRDGLELLRRCVESILRITSYPGNLSIIVVDNQSSDPGISAYFEQLRQRNIQILSHPYSFNYPAINNRAVHACDSEVIGLINNDVECLHEDWLSNMVGLLMRQDTGAVGAKLLWPNKMVQHGGVVGGFHGLAIHVGNQWQNSDYGYGGVNQVTQRFSAVTAACLLLRRKDYLTVHGMDEKLFPVAFNDVDLCLKLRQHGKNIVWCPDARLIHAESVSRGRDETPEKNARFQREMNAVRARWKSILAYDSAYNPNLSSEVISYPFSSLALPPRSRHPRSAELPDNQVLEGNDFL